MTAFKIFMLGVREFRWTFTTHFDYPEIVTYNLGRECAHRLTFRLWDN